ncbi:MAG: TetR family transcriptional regulator [Chloroflexi bacterium]|nr:TetR family transcriptional regulator [Chloroflexota bacterium]
MADKVDRRVRRTRRRLGEALVALIAERGYDTLTVEEIAERADVGRTTFYSHYQDKDDLLLEVTGEVAEQIEQQFLRLLASDDVGKDEITGEVVEEVEQHFLHLLASNGVSIEDVIALMFRLAGENVEMYRLIMNGQCGPLVFRQFQEKLTSLFQSILETKAEKRGHPLPLPAPMIANYFWGALQATIVWWLGSDQPYSAQAMVQMFYRLSIQGTGEVLGADPARWGLTPSAD